jgi:hypothetical protein
MTSLFLRCLITLAGVLLVAPLRADESIAFCHPLVPSAASESYETASNRPRLSNSDRLDIDDAVAQVKIEPLTATDRQKLKARFAALPAVKGSVQRQYAPAVPFDLQHRIARATAYVLVDKNGKVEDVYIGEHTNELSAKAAALTAKSFQFKPQAEESITTIPISFNGPR